MQKKLYLRLKNQGWSKADIKSVTGLPIYEDRIKFIGEHMKQTRLKRHEFLDVHMQPFPIMPGPEIDDNQIIAVKGPYNHIFDNSYNITREIRKIRNNSLPKEFLECDFIIANKGCSKLYSYV